MSYQRKPYPIEFIGRISPAASPSQAAPGRAHLISELEAAAYRVSQVGDAVHIEGDGDPLVISPGQVLIRDGGTLKALSIDAFNAAYETPPKRDPATVLEAAQGLLGHIEQGLSSGISLNWLDMAVGWDCYAAASGRPSLKQLRRR